MSRRITVYLTDKLDEAMEATQLKPAELLWRGVEAVMNAAEAPADEEMRLTPREVTQIEAALQARPQRIAALDCKHPRARRQKGLCMACGTHVGEV